MKANDICKYWDSGYCYGLNPETECPGFMKCPYYEPRKKEKTMKRYELNIPQTIYKKDAYIAHELETVTEVMEFGGPATTVPGYTIVEAPGGICLHVPNKWLEEIEDGPVSIEQYMDRIINEDTRTGDCHRCWVQGNRQGFEKGEENERKRQKHQ